MNGPEAARDENGDPESLNQPDLPKRRRRLLILGIVGGALALLAIAAIVWATRKEDSPPASPPPAETTEQEDETPAIKCKPDENKEATKQIFCSDDMGIKLTVPGWFMGTLAKGKNYNLYAYDFDKNESVVVGQSELVYEATYNDPKNSEMANVYKLLIAKTPLVSRSGPCFAQCYFDSQTKTLYEDKTGFEDTKLSLGRELESVTVDGTKFFKGVIGDAGDYNVTYLGVIGNNVIEITLQSTTYLGETSEPYAVDRDQIFIDFDNLLKTFQVLD